MLTDVDRMWILMQVWQMESFLVVQFETLKRFTGQAVFPHMHAYALSMHIPICILILIFPLSVVTTPSDLHNRPKNSPLQNWPDHYHVLFGGMGDSVQGNSFPGLSALLIDVFCCALKVAG